MPTLSADQIAGYAKGAGFTGPDVSIATAVALAESGGRTDATNHNTNGSTDFGVWQINSVHAALLAGRNWQDPAQNAQMAYAVWKGSGWRAWSTYNNGHYLAHLGVGQGAAGASAIGTGTSDTSSDSGNPAATAGITSLGQFFTFASDPHNWQRFAWFIGGLVLLCIALWVLISRTKAYKSSVKVAKQTAEVAAMA